CGIDSKTVRRLRANLNIEMKTLDRICSFLDCKIEDVVEFIKD
ncbi:MAG: helix-turn-helix transcriptional regulator, partial [Clostridia bacterium]|nr:helix-turn-helix transcriptional regulator [Clostridia bacterium]